MKDVDDSDADDDADDDAADDPYVSESESLASLASTAERPAKKSRKAAPAIEQPTPRQQLPTRDTKPSPENVKKFLDGVFSYKVRWFTFVATDAVKKRKLHDQAHLRELMVKASETRKDCIIEWDYAVQRFAEGHFAVLPPEAVDFLEKVPFVRVATTSKSVDVFGTVKKHQLVWWTDEGRMFKAGSLTKGMLTQDAFKRIKLDFCETRDRQHGMIGPAAEAAAASSSAPAVPAAAAAASAASAAAPAAAAAAAGR